MAQEMTDSTRVMEAPGAPGGDRTLVAGAAMPAMAPGPNATQMGATITCPVCKSNNPGLETYCIECGFLLSSIPGTAEPVSEESAGPALELVESSSGRTFRLKEGVNTVGRENCDILLIDGTVSRRHSQITVEGGALSVTDLGSTNGTQVDGVRIAANQPIPFAPGAIIRFGNSTLTLPTGAAAAAEATIVTPPSAEESVAVEVDSAPEAVSEQTLIAEPSMLVAEASTPAAVPEAEPEPAEPIVARLISTTGEPDIEIRTGTVSIGRRLGNTIVLAGDPYVSGRHAELVAEHSGIYLVDVGSTNGTVVNGTRLDPGARQPLVDGDEVNLGQGTYRFHTVAGPPTLRVDLEAGESA